MTSWLITDTEEKRYHEVVVIRSLYIQKSACCVLIPMTSIDYAR